MRWPLDKFFISNGFSSSHAAIDLATFGAVEGLEVKSPIAGTVVATNEDVNTIGGKYVIVRSNDGRYDHYTGHHSSILVRYGQRVNEGDIIAKVGSTGTQVTGPHVHYQIRDLSINKLINPQIFLEQSEDMYEGKTAKQWYDEYVIQKNEKERVTNTIANPREVEINQLKIDIRANSGDIENYYQWLLFRGVGNDSLAFKAGAPHKAVIYGIADSQEYKDLRRAIQDSMSIVGARTVQELPNKITRSNVKEVVEDVQRTLNKYK